MQLRHWPIAHLRSSVLLAHGERTTAPVDWCCRYPQSFLESLLAMRRCVSNDYTVRGRSCIRYIHRTGSYNHLCLTLVTMQSRIDRRADFPVFAGRLISSQMAGCKALELQTGFNTPEYTYGFPLAKESIQALLPPWCAGPLWYSNRLSQ